MSDLRIQQSRFERIKKEISVGKIKKISVGKIKKISVGKIKKRNQCGKKKKSVWEKLTFAVSVSSASFAHDSAEKRI